MRSFDPQKMKLVDPLLQAIQAAISELEENLKKDRKNDNLFKFEVLDRLENRKVTEWAFEIQRDGEGKIKTVIAKAKV
jgi:hypothetical protein